MKQILFVCKHNRYRSQIAQAYFNLTNKNKNYHAQSAGIFVGNPIGKTVKQETKKLGIILNGKPKPLFEKDFTKWEQVIIVADNVPLKLFRSKRFKKITQWDIPDTKEDNIPEIQKGIKAIIKKVDSLIKTLK